MLFSGAPGVTGFAPGPVNPMQTRMLARAMVEAGIRPSNKHRRVGEYQLGAVIGEGDGPPPRPAMRRPICSVVSTWNA